MYPVFRMAKELLIHRNAPALALTGMHVSQHTCWPWDLDLWMELNNGRTLTLYDLGRLPYAGRIGLNRAIQDNHWGMTVAGVSVRFRRRVRVFERVEIRTRALGWDEKFLYLEQSMWKRDGDCSSHGVYRMAVTDKNGIVPPLKAVSAIGHDGPSPKLPDWVQAWVTAEAVRPWPPQMDTV